MIASLLFREKPMKLIFWDKKQRIFFIIVDFPNPKTADECFGRKSESFSRTYAL